MHPRDALLRSACEAALLVARAGSQLDPPIAVPRPLLRMLGFAHLPDAAVATVRRSLDDDEAFRARVALALDLADETDDLDEAAVLFLGRPEGWEARLDALEAAAATAAAADRAQRDDAVAGRRLPQVEAALRRAEAQRQVALDDASTARAELVAERRARRTVDSELGRIRKRIAELEGAPGAGATGGADAAAAIAAAEARADVATTASSAAEGRAVAADARAAAADARAAAAEAALAALRAVPVEPPVDVRAAGSAVSDAVAAVGALADSLARAAALLDPDRGGQVVDPHGGDVGAGGGVPAGATRPAGPRRTPVPLPPATLEEGAEAAGHLLRRPGVVVLVDGYNVTIARAEGLPLPEQRRRLVAVVQGLAARTGARFELVFDGEASSRPAWAARRSRVEIRFTEATVEADDELLAMVTALPVDRPVVVVSDDRRVRDGARRLGANVLGVAQLLDAARR